MEFLFNYIDRINKYICAASLAVMVLLIFFNTVLRYFFHSSIVVTEEVCRFLFVWATFLAVVTVWHEKKHIAVTMITDKLHGRFGRGFNFLCSFITVFCFLSVIYGSYEYILINSYYAQITGITYAVMIFPVMLSAFLCLVMVIADMLKLLSQKD